MYSTKTAITAITMSLKDLLDKVTDYDIYSYYIGAFKPGKLLNSPLRPDDKIPSFAIFPSKTGDLLLLMKPILIKEQTEQKSHTYFAE